MLNASAMPVAEGKISVWAEERTTGLFQSSPSAILAYS